MNCPQCVQAKRKKTIACATCQHIRSSGQACGEPICLPSCPNGIRPHGDECTCTCGMTICNAHLQDHLAGKSTSGGVTSVVGCFSTLAGIEAYDTVCHSVGALRGNVTASELPEAATEAINSFINIVAPGTPALRSIIEEGASAVRIDRDRWAAQDELFIRLNTSILPEDIVEKLVLLSAYALGSAWASRSHALPEALARFAKRTPNFLSRLEDEFRRPWLLDSLAAWSKGEAEAPDLTRTGTFTVISSAERTVREKVTYALRQELPSNGADIARWLIEEDFLRAGALT
jgi:hypothetical protein